MSFGVLATLLGFIVDAISLYQIIKGLGEKKGGLSKINGIMLVIGTIAIVIGLMGIFSNGLTIGEFDTVSSENGESNTLSESNNVSSDDVLFDNNSSDSTSSEELDVEAIRQTLKDQSGKVWIDEMQIFAYDDGGYSVNEYTMESVILTNAGDNLQHNLVFECRDFGYKSIYAQYLEFYLNNNYSHFNGVLALLDESKETKGSYLLEIICDDETVVKIQVSKGLVPTDIDLDISSVKMMKIQITNTTFGEGNLKVAFGDAYFTKK